jgi:hypothetical protein
MPVGYRTIDQIDLNDIWYGGAGIAAAFDLYQAVDLPILNSIAMMHDETIMKYGLSERNGFQPLGPGERPNRKYVQTAIITPAVQKYGYAVGTDIDTLLRSSGKEIQMDMDRPFKEDPEFLLTEMIRMTLLDPGVNNVGYGWYNGQFAPEEGITAPPRFMQRTFLANHTHYLTTTTASLQLSDLTMLKTHIRHHGNQGQLVAFCNSTVRQTLENLAAWTGNIIRSPISDEVAVHGFGDTFLLLGIQFYVTEMMPDNYILCMVASGVESERALIMFEPANMKGLTIWPGTWHSSYPLIDATVSRTFGLKIIRRGAGAVLFITGTGTYTPPVIT